MKSTFCSPVQIYFQVSNDMLWLTSAPPLHPYVCCTRDVTRRGVKLVSYSIFTRYFAAQCRLSPICWVETGGLRVRYFVGAIPLYLFSIHFHRCSSRLCISCIAWVGEYIWVSCMAIGHGFNYLAHCVFTGPGLLSLTCVYVCLCVNVLFASRVWID